MHDAPPPRVVIGGLGGGGTRLVAGLVASAGIHLGHDLNGALDNLWVTLLFKRAGLLTMSGAGFDDALALLSQATHGTASLDDRQRALLAELAAHDRPQHPAEWLQERAHTLAEAARRPSHIGCWGWKEPNSHMLLPFLERMPGTRYIHVVRDGLYMAHSRNRNQLWYWGEALTGEPMQLTPRYALHYWCAAQARAQAFAARMGGRFLMLDYNRLCASPDREIDRLQAFLGAPGDIDGSLVVGRWADAFPDPTEADAFDASDLTRALDWRHGGMAFG